MIAALNTHRQQIVNWGTIMSELKECPLCNTKAEPFDNGVMHPLPAIGDCALSACTFTAGEWEKVCAGINIDWKTEAINLQNQVAENEHELESLAEELERLRAENER